MTFDHKFGHVKYTVRAVLKGAWRFADKVDSTTIQVHGILDATKIAPEPTFFSADQSSCCLCCATGPVTTEIHIPHKTAFSPGENMEIIVKMTNKGSRAIHQIRASLLQKLTFLASYKKMEIDKEIEEIGLRDQRIGPGESGDCVFKYSVPNEIQPSKLGGRCKVIQLEYTIHVSYI